MKTNTPGSQRSDRLLIVLVGALVGMLATCCSGVAVLLLLGVTPAATPAAPPPAYDVEAIVEEAYINRSMQESAITIPSPLPMVAGQLDILPGGQAHFVSQMEVGPLRPVFEGTIRLQPSPAGGLEVEFLSVQVGYLPVTPLVPTSQIAAINLAINQMVQERAGPIDLQVVGVTSDETTLHIYLAVAP
jgi:hypothetical protein